MKKQTRVVIIALSVLVLTVFAFLCWSILKKDTKVAQSGNILGVEWYNTEEKEFTITTASELKELASLSDYYNFKDQTIKLGADIIVNEGNAVDWVQNEPEERWLPINGFAGVFEGQGHTVSGVYGTGYETPMALFTNTDQQGVVRDFKLKNSYFKTSGNGGTGSISSGGGGKFSRIYSDAIIDCNGHFAGGIAGKLDRPATFDECWYDGKLTITLRHGGGIVGGIEKGRTTIKNSLFSGELYSSYNDGGNNIGGVCGSIRGTGTMVFFENNLSVGNMEVANAANPYTGSVLGVFYSGTSVVSTDCYGSRTTHAGGAMGPGGIQGKKTGGFVNVKLGSLIGYNSYRWTTLDFEKYWAVVEDSTPILQCFAEDIPSLEGIEKRVDISWYDEDAGMMTIDSLADLYGFYIVSHYNSFAGKTIRLGADIVMNEGNAADWAKKPPENEWIPIDNFYGKFDGAGHTISGLYMNEGENCCTGFFLRALDGEIKNVQFTNCYMRGVDRQGQSIVATIFRGTMDSVYTDGILEVQVDDEGIVQAGGLIGLVTGETTIKNCWFDGKITTNGRLFGGIIGTNFTNTDVKVSVENCLVTGTLNCKNPINSVVGGFCGLLQGKNNSLIIKDSLFAGEINYLGPVDGKMGSAGTYVGRVGYPGRGEGEVITFQSAYSVVTDYPSVEYIDSGCTKNSGVRNLSNKELSGELARSNTKLDFVQYWKTQKTDCPILRTFSHLKKRAILESKDENYTLAWYDPDAKVLELKTAEDLYGLYIVSKDDSFKGKTIKLGADIIVNEGDASKWADGTATLPKNVWKAIPKFEGTFDGCGHSIKGLYMNGAGQNFFIKTASNCTIKDVRFVGGYTKSTGTGNATVAETFSGTMSGVYSDTIFDVSVGEDDSLTGGLIMCGAKGNATIEDCWYAGEITSDGRKIGGITAYVSAHKNVKVSIKNCLVTGTMNCGIDWNSKVGGFVGEHGTANVELTISDCVFAGDILYKGSKNAQYWGIGSAGVLLGVSTQTSFNITTSNLYSVKRTGIYKGHASITPIELYDIENTLGTVNGKKYSSYSGGLYNLSVRLDDEKLQDKAAYENTRLDFDTKWVIQANNYPVPQALKDMAKGNLITSTAGLKKAYDISWYDENATEMVIDSREDLYGLYIMSQHNTFKGKTIKLGADIVVNEGDASKWADGTAALPKNVWKSIPKFEGTFDGCGHSIQGLYMNGAGQNFFIKTASNCTIKDVRFVGGYTKSTGAGNATVAETFSGTMSGVYSDTIFDVGKSGNDSLTGGLIMCGATGNATIEDCWFAGQITADGQKIGGIAAYVSAHKNVKVSIKNCLVTGTINCGFNYNSKAGGFVGEHNTANVTLNISDSVFAGDILYKGAKELPYWGLGSTGVLLGICGQTSNSIITSNIYSVKRIGIYRGDLSTTPIELYDIENALGTVNGKTYSSYSGGLYNLSVRLDDEKLQDKAVYENTWLDFDKKWVMQANNYPVPKALKDMVKNSLITSTDGLEKVCDTRWYDRNATEMVIDSREDLYGLYIMSQHDTFKGKTIKLGADIVVNEGDTSKWADGTAALPKNVWKSIPKFEGTLDGCGHSIKGLYMNGAGQNFFIKTASNCTIKDVRFVGGYTKSTGGGNATVAETFSGTMSGVYSDTIFDVGKSGNDSLTGGLVMCGATGNATIEDCWYAGQITADGQKIGGIAAYASAHQNVQVSIKNCLVTGTINCGFNYNSKAGGFVGEHNTANVELTVSDSVFAGDILYKGAKELPYWGLGSTGVLLGICGQTSNSIITSNIYSVKRTGIYRGDLSTTPIELYDVENVLGTVNGKTYSSYSGGLYDLSVRLDAGKLQDKAAYENTWLDFDKKWVMQANNYPVPKALKDMAKNSLITSTDGLERTYDIRWYDRKATEMVIDSREDLYGLYIMSQHDTFKGKTIKLGADIVVNEGNASKWADGTAALPKNVWKSIPKFEGTFDGCGHSIQGLYMNGAGQNFFIKTASNCTIKDVRFVGGYTKSTGKGNATVAEIFSGTMSGVYSDTIFDVNSGESRTGGLIMCALGKATINNCWFAGKITTTGNYIGGIASTVSVVNGVTMEIENCLVTAKITCKKAYNSLCGGFVGQQSDKNESLTVKNSIFAGDIVYAGDSTGQTYYGLGSTGIIVGICYPQDASNSITTENVYSVDITELYRNDKNQGQKDSLCDTENAQGTVNGTMYSNLSGRLYTLTIRPGNDKMKGNDARTYMSGLNFDTVWATRENDYPALQQFKDIF